MRRSLAIKCLLATALFALLLPLFAVVLNPTAYGQAKKAEKKAEKKIEKAEPAQKETKIVDVIVATGGVAEQVAAINEALAKGWKDNKITPAARCTDYEFIRRASLDIIGRIASLREIERYMSDPPERRRSLLIERLLGNPEFVNPEAKTPEYEGGREYTHNWANIWTALLMTRRSTPKLHQNQLREWFEDELAEKYETTKDGKTRKLVATPDWSKIVTQLLTAQGATNDNLAVNYVMAHLGEAIRENPMANGKYDMVPLTSRTTRLFLGLRTQCVQCHDHPFNGEWLQSHFWGINAFFRQLDPDGRPTMMAQGQKNMGKLNFSIKDNPNLNVKGIVPYERRSGVLLYTDPTFLDGKKMPSAKDPNKATRRVELAHFVTTSPYFAKAFVNRTWGHFFGRSFTKDAVDDFGEHNPVSHPELLDRIADDWAKKYNHDPKALIRWICNSRAYGLSSTANSTNDKPEDEAFFARMLLKPMSPEQLFDSLMTATDARPAQNVEAKAKLREAWLDKLIINFGDDEGNEGSFNGTVVQALMLMNGQDINTAIMDKDSGTAALVMKRYPPSNAATAAKAMDELFKAALNRPPNAKELAKIMNAKTFALHSGGGAGSDPVAFWTGYYQDVFWALLNSNEFILNH
jgi:hypothetical protein